MQKLNSEPETKGHDRAHRGTTCLQRGATLALSRGLEREARRAELVADLPAGSLIIARSSIFERTTTGQSGTFASSRPRMTMAATLGVPRWRTMPASFVTAVQTSIAEPDRDRIVNPHPRSGLWRSQCDPIRIRPRPLHLKAEQRDQIVADDDRDVRFAGLILGQLPGLIGIRILSCGRDQMSSFRRKTSRHRKGRERQALTAAMLRWQPPDQHRSNGYHRDR